MKLPVAAACLLSFSTAALADGGHPERLGPIPPDPVTVKRVSSDVTPAGLALQRMSLPSGLHLWELLKATVPLTTPQVRTIALDLLRVRRFYDEEHPADAVFIAAWFDRDPAAATREILNIPDWEDRDDNIGDYDSDVEYFGERLWVELSRTDFPAALRIAAGLKGIETKGQFFSGIIYRHSFTPAQASAMVKLAIKQLPDALAREFTGSLARRLHQQHGLDAAVKWARGLPEASFRETVLSQIENSGATAPEADDLFEYPPLDDPELKALRAMDISGERACRIPFALLREVLRRTPVQALELLKKLPENQRQAPWLGWMLYMRAADGEALDAGGKEMALRTPGWIHLSNVLPLIPALNATAADAMESLRKTPAETQDRALESALTRAPLEDWEQWLALANELAASPHVIRPLVIRMAAAGHGARAVELAFSQPAGAKETKGQKSLVQEAAAAWALHDFRAAAAFAAKQAPGSLREALCHGLAYALHRLPAQTVLQHWPDALSAAEVEPNDHYWIYLAFENIEAGFRFFSSRTDRDSAWAASLFARAAARFDPVRAVQVVNHFFDDRITSTNLLCCIVRHWPRRFHEFLAPVSDEATWQVVARTAARIHPDKTAAILEGVPFTSVWDAAGQELAFSRPDLMKAIAPRMSEAIRYRVMVEKRRD